MSRLMAEAIEALMNREKVSDGAKRRFLESIRNAPDRGTSGEIRRSREGTPRTLTLRVTQLPIREAGNVALRAQNVCASPTDASQRGLPERRALRSFSLSTPFDNEHRLIVDAVLLADLAQVSVVSGGVFEHSVADLLR